MDEVYAGLTDAALHAEEKASLVADSVYAHVWEQAMSGGFAAVV